MDASRSLPQLCAANLVLPALTHVKRTLRVERQAHRGIHDSFSGQEPVAMLNHPRGLFGHEPSRPTAAHVFIFVSAVTISGYRCNEAGHGVDLADPVVH